MATRRTTGYGTAKMPSMAPGRAGVLPPPPDGKPAVRLPIGGGRRSMAQQQPPVEEMPGQSDDEILQALLTQLGGRPDAM